MADNAASGNLTTAWDGVTPATAPAGSIVLLAPGRDSSVGVRVSGTFVATVILETSIDGLNWDAPSVTTLAGAGSAATFTTPASKLVSTGGAALLRARCSAYTSGTAVVVMAGTPGAGGGGGGGGGGGAATIADGADVAEGTTTDVPITTTTTGAAATGIGLWKGFVNLLISLRAQFPAALVGGRLDVNVGATGVTQPVSGTVTITPSGTQTVSGTVTANAGSGPFPAAGTVAHGTANSGNPITEGRVAIAHGTNPTAVAAAARTDMYANRAGIPFVIGGHPNVQTISTNFAAAQTDVALVTVAAGLKIVVTSVMLKCHAANTVNVSARVGFGVANTPAYGSAGLLLTDPGCAPGSGSGRGGGGGILGVGTDDQDVRLTCSAPTGGSIDCMVSYYTCES